MDKSFKAYKSRIPNAVVACVLALFVSFNVLARESLTSDPAGCAVRIANLTARQEARADDILGRFGQFSVNIMPNHIGFEMRHREQRKDRLQRTLIISSPNEDIDLPRRQIWEYNGEKYEFLSLGLINLAPYSTKVNEQILNHLRNHLDEDLTIIFDGQRIQEGQTLRRFRYAVHTAVLDSYKEEKPYLNDRDFRILRHANLLSGNSDVFALVKYKEGGVQTVEELEENLLMAVQVSYYGNHTYITPNLRSVLAADGLQIFSDDDLLPFEYRIPMENREGFREIIYSTFDPASTGEILRYRNWDPRLPRPIVSLFNLYTFDAGTVRGVQTYLASAATDTTKLFERNYYFKKFGLLPVVQNLEPEYLDYLRVGSWRYKKLRSKLVRKSKDVAVTEVGRHDRRE